MNELAQSESGHNPVDGLRASVRDQLIGLGWASAIAGALLTLLEVPILGLDGVGKILPYTLTALLLGSGLLFWLDQRRGLAWLLGLFGAWLAGALGSVSDSFALPLIGFLPELAGAMLFVQRRHWYDLCWLGILDGFVDLVVRLGSAEGLVFSASTVVELLPLVLGVAGLGFLLSRSR
ncbi:MAG: hypothetical protein D6761_09670 [Candidatus Dadabacteria bacterium]|nr:MAG: hypothetical protein D6761_09670 [Candidatus Dadabacteria bacterium]